MSDGIRCLHPAAPEHYSVTLNDFGEGGNICNMVLQKLKDLSPLRNIGTSDTSCKEQQISVFSPVKLILFVDAQVLVIMHTSTLMLTGLKWVLCFQKSTTKILSLCNVKWFHPHHSTKLSVTFFYSALSLLIQPTMVKCLLQLTGL